MKFKTKAEKTFKKNWPHLFLKKTLVLLTSLSVMSFSTRYSSVDDPGESSNLLQKEVSGTVTDPNGNPLPGAAVLEKGTNNGVTTDFDGNFTISVDDQATLTISFIGFTSVDKVVANTDSFDITLFEDAANLDEVVIIGYGAVKKSDLTGSVSTIKTEQIETIPVNNVGDLLQGRSTGLRIIKNTDDPEGGMSVRLRGASSLTGSREPLVVLDGIPFGSLTNLNQLNASDIESIEILKDASAAAIYGSQGANGVILITTKSGKSGTFQGFVETSFSTSEFSRPWERYGNLVDIATIKNRGMLNDDFAPEDVQYNGSDDGDGFYYPTPEEFASGAYQYYDWAAITMNTNPSIQSHKAGVRGGSEKNNYLLSLSYFQQEGMVKGDEFDRINIFFKDEMQLTDNLSFRFSASYNDIDRVYGTGRQIEGRAWIKPFNDDGSYYLPFEGYTHPLQQKDDNFNTRKGKDLITNASFDWEIIPGLTFRTIGSYNSLKSNFDQYTKSQYTLLSQSYAGRGLVREQSNEQTYFTNTLTYNKTFDDIHDISVLVGRDDQIRTFESIGIIGQDFVTDALFNQNLTLATADNQFIEQSYNRQDLQSYFGRANYNLMDKYLFTLTYRADGSSKFGVNNKWGHFPAAAVAWKIHEEDFLTDSKISNLKLRASYGVTGNQGINPYQTFERYGSLNVYDSAVGSDLLSAGPNQLGTPDLKWETTTQYAAAIESGFFNNRLRFNIEYYFKETSDLIRSKFLPTSSGFAQVLVNDGIIENQGIEFELAGEIIQKRDFTLSANLFFSANKNKVVDIGTVEDAGLVEDDAGNKYVFATDDGQQVYALGQPLESFYGYTSGGIINEESQKQFAFGEYKKLGDMYYTDLNGDDTINPSDRTVIGDPTPDFITSLNLNLTYKRFDLNMLFNAVVGNDVLDEMRDNRPYGKLRGWTPENPNTGFKMVRNSNNFIPSTFYVVDGSFLRLQNVSAGYDIPLGDFDIIKSARIFANVTNVFTIDNYEGYDAEVNVEGFVDGGIYGNNSLLPRLRTFNFGLNITF